MEIIIKTLPIKYVGDNAVMTFVLSGDLNRTDTIKINLKENSIGPFVPSRDYRKAVISMLWAETIERINALKDDKEILELNHEFEQAFNEACKQ